MYSQILQINHSIFAKAMGIISTCWYLHGYLHNRNVLISLPTCTVFQIQTIVGKKPHVLYQLRSLPMYVHEIPQSGILHNSFFRNIIKFTKYIFASDKNIFMSSEMWLLIFIVDYQRFLLIRKRSVLYILTYVHFFKSELLSA
jgi:hypothetical protein